MDRSGVAIIIPAFNEAKTIGVILKDAAEFGQPIVVDDGSSDGTADVCRSHGAEVVVHKTNRGYDGALNSGFARAERLGIEFAITIDADGQLPAHLIPEYLRNLESGADLVVGIRDHVPRISERVFQLIANRLFHIDDPLCGMKGYRLHHYRELGWFDSYRSIGTELMAFVARKNGRIVQIPLPTKPRVGRPRIGGSLRANYIIARAAFILLIRQFKT